MHYCSNLFYKYNYLAHYCTETFSSLGRGPFVGLGAVFHGVVAPVAGSSPAQDLLAQQLLLLLYLGEDALVLLGPAGQVRQHLLHRPVRHVLVHRVPRLAWTHTIQDTWFNNTSNMWLDIHFLYIKLHFTILWLKQIYSFCLKQQYFVHKCLLR